MIQRRVFITGKVQGVGFRFATYVAVQRFPSVRGYVKNLPNGKVEAVFLGSDEEVSEMIEWSKRGPSSARVDGVEVVSESVDESLSSFSIERD